MTSDVGMAPGVGRPGRDPVEDGRSRSSLVTSSESASNDRTSRWRRTSRAMSSDVLGQGVVAAADEGQRPGREDQVDRGSRARPERDVALELGQAVRLGVAGRGGQPDRVLEQAPGRRRRCRRRACIASRPSVDRTARTSGIGAGHPLDDDELLGRRRVADQHLEHEPVDLRLGQRVRALGLDRVLRRQDEERARGPCASRARSSPGAPA